MKSGKRACRKKEINSASVIGAGFSGLVSSLLLARAGLQVTLVERDGHAAPLLRNYNREGFEVNHGFHYLGGYYPGGALHQCFEQLGIAGKLTPIDLDENGFDCFTGITDEKIVLPVGKDRVRAVLEKTFPQSLNVIAEYFQLMETVFQEFSFFNIESYFYKVTPSLTGVSLLEFLRERQAEDRLIDFLDTYSQMLLGLSAGEVSLLSHLLGIGAYFYSARTFKGGGGALVDALEEQVRKAGVKILTGSEAVAIQCESRRLFTGLRIRSINDGLESDLETDACISTIHPKRLRRLLKNESAQKIYSRRIAGYSDTRAVCIFHLAVKKEAASAYTSNYHTFERQESGELDHQATLLPDFTRTTDPLAVEQPMTVMITAWENDEEKGCPERLNRSCTGAFRLPAAARGAVETGYLDRLGAEMTARLERQFPGLKGNYRIVNAAGPCQFDRLNATWDGSIYGVKCSVNRLGMSTIGPVKGLLLAGQSVVAPGIFGALVSAYLAANRITGN
jgi:all-trans-retinol 13,14-reductase